MCPGSRSQRGHLDLLGPLPKVASTYVYSDLHRPLFSMARRHSPLRMFKSPPLWRLLSSTAGLLVLVTVFRRLSVPLSVAPAGNCFTNGTHWLWPICALRTTAYHPQANGMIGHFHRHSSVSMMSEPNRWCEHLPLLLFIKPPQSCQDGCKLVSVASLWDNDSPRW